jgi:ATP-dependent protease ClpP protease subunit
MKFAYRTEHNAKAVSAFWGRPIEGKAPYEIKATSTDQTELFVTDVLGWPFNDINALVRDLSTIKTKDILVRLNSPGGDPIDTFSLYHAFKNHPSNVIFRIEALAASAASFLPLSGNEVQAYPSSLMMIHNSWVMAIGNRFDLQATADILEKIDTNMQDIYTAKTKIGKKEMADMMKAETWFTAKEAKAKGFIDTILDGKPVKAEFDLSFFANLPDEFKEDKELTERDAEKILRDAGFSRHKAKAVLAGRRDAEGAADKDEQDAKELVEYLTIASELKKVTAILHV